MLFNYSQKIVSIMIFCLSIYILLTFYIYSTQGDMNNLIKDIKKLKKVKDKDEIIDRLFHIIVDNKSSVKWPIIVSISIIISSLITYCTSGINNLDQKFLITSAFIFLTIYGMFNFLKTHGGQNQLIKSVILHNNKN
jgi:hypothetical protein